MLQSVHIDDGTARALDLAAEIGFGEIYHIDLRSPQRKLVEYRVSADQQRFVELIEDLGIQHIDKLTVHNGCPSVMEVPGMKYGLAYRRKLKIT